MILVILVGVAGLWLVGKWHPAGWGLAAAAHLLWLPYALAASQPGFVLAVAAFGVVSLRNHRKNQMRPRRRLPRRSRYRR